MVQTSNTRSVSDVFLSRPHTTTTTTLPPHALSLSTMNRPFKGILSDHFLYSPRWRLIEVVQINKGSCQTAGGRGKGEGKAGCDWWWGAWMAAKISTSSSVVPKITSAPTAWTPHSWGLGIPAVRWAVRVTHAHIALLLCCIETAVSKISSITSSQLFPTLFSVFINETYQFKSSVGLYKWHFKCGDPYVMSPAWLGSRYDRLCASPLFPHKKGQAAHTNSRNGTANKSF